MRWPFQKKPVHNKGIDCPSCDTHYDSFGWSLTGQMTLRCTECRASLEIIPDAIRFNVYVREL